MSKTRRDFLRAAAAIGFGAYAAPVRAVVPTTNAVAAVTAGLWTPKNLGANLLAWWRSDYGLYQDTTPSTVAAANNDPVAYWADKSGNGHHIYQTGASSKRPLLKTNELNGLPALLFDGSDDCLFSVDNITLSLFTYWMVAKRVGTAGILYEQSLNVNVSAGSSWFLDGNGSTFQAVRRGITTSSYTSTAGNYVIDTSAYGLYAHEFGGTGQHADHKRYKNNVTSNYTTNVASGSTGNPGTGSVADVIYFGQRANLSAAGNFYLIEAGYASLLGLSDLSKLGKYIASRYGLSITT